MSKGVALITVLIISGLLILLAIGFAFIMVAENKISQAQELAQQTHYLAEAGTQYALWQLNNNWKDDFENGILNEELPLTDALYPGDEIRIEAKSVPGQPGEAKIISQAKYRDAQREVIVEVFKPLGGITEPLEIKAILSGEVHESQKEDKNIYLIISRLDVQTGSVHSNNDLKLNASDVWIEDTASSVGQIQVDDASNLYVDPEKRIEGAPKITMPALDFDKYKDEALVLDEAYLNSCLAGGECVLNGINYIAGKSCTINIGDIEKGEGPKKLTLNGFLLTDCSVNVDFGSSLLIHNSSGQPSGLASQGSIKINPLANVNITGLLYGLDDITIHAASTFSLSGGIINSGDFLLLNQTNKIDINYDENIIKAALGQPEDAPLITINHWEEEY